MLCYAQAEGLSGHLSQFWGDVMNSIWIGGSADGGLHERAPYWLNGVVPLAFLLRNAGITTLPAVTGIYKKPWGHNAWLSDVCEDGVDMSGEDIAGSAGYHVDGAEKCRDDCASNGACYGFVVDNCTAPMTCWLKGGAGPTSKKGCRCYGKNVPKPQPVDVMAQAERYVQYILGHQNADGWLGPNDKEEAGFGGADYWGPSNVLQALLQYAEGHRDNATTFANASGAVMAHLLEQRRRMPQAPLSSWARARWLDMAHSAEWVLDHAAVGEHEEELLQLVNLLHDQGYAWDEWYETRPMTSADNMLVHNVNLAQAPTHAIAWTARGRVWAVAMLCAALLLL